MGGMKSPKQMVKKLRKLWSRKKAKKKDPQQPYSYYSCHYQQQHHLIIPHPPLPPSSQSQYHPSAPPLPPWPEAEDLYVAAPTTWLHSSAEISPSCECPTVTVNVSSAHQDTNSYQQYLDPSPVYVEPNSVTAKRRCTHGVLVKFGFNLISCLFPCFPIRDEVHCKEEKKKLLQ